jgi:hypothetical protein
MPYLHKFNADDIYINRLVTKPIYEVTFYSGSSYINNSRHDDATIPSGSINLYEMNVGRELTSSIVVVGDNESNQIYPFAVKDGSLDSWSSISKAEYNAMDYGTLMTSSYPLTASIQREVIAAATLPSAEEGSTDTFFSARKRMMALGSTINSYKIMSPRFEYSSSNPAVDKPLLTGSVNLISVPSIFYDSGIRPGTVDLKFHYTGTLMDQAIDENQNGELVSTMGDTSGSVVGLVLYNEGFIMLTSSQTITPNYDDYTNDGVQSAATWMNFAAYSGTNSQNYATSSVYSVGFRGTSNIPTITMFAVANAGDLNNSQNPTWVSASHKGWREGIVSNSGSYIEPRDLAIKNTIQSEFCRHEKDFQKQVFISKIGIFDTNKNLIAIAKVANPVIKREEDSYTFKLKLDL